MKKALTTATAGFLSTLSTAAWAHPGHDHSDTIGGEAHILLWGLASTAALVALYYVLRQRRTRAQRAEERM